MSGQIFVSLLVTVYRTKLGMENGLKIVACGWIRTVLGDVVEIVPSDDDGTGHFGGNDLAGQDTPTNRDVTSEGALLVW